MFRSDHGIQTHRKGQVAVQYVVLNIITIIFYLVIDCKMRDMLVGMS